MSPLFRLFAAAVTALLSTGALSAPLFRATDLGDLAGGENYSRVFGLNNHGELVGESGAALDGWTGRRGFLWSAGAMHGVGKSLYTLERLDWWSESGETQASSLQWHATHFESSARAIDDSGRVFMEVGQRFARPLGEERLYLGQVIRTEARNADTPQIDARVVQPTMYVNSVSGNGHAGGIGLTGRAAVWAPEAPITELENGAGRGWQLSLDFSGAALGVNDDGLVVGISNGLPVLWRQDGSVEELPVFDNTDESPGCPNMPGAYTLCVTGTSAFVLQAGAATGINSHGHIIGYTHEGGFLIKDGAVTRLSSGAQMLDPRAINDAGDIVGSFSDGRAALREHGGSILDLTAVTEGLEGWQLTEAVAVNAHGQIAANGLRNGVTHAFLLTPVPEPAIVWLMSGGLLVLRLRRGISVRS